MDRDDFDFPLDPAAEDAHEAGAIGLSAALPLRVLTHTAIDELPPTVVPSAPQRPIGQAMRSLLRAQGRSVRRQAAARAAEPAAASPAPEGTEAAEGTERGEGEETRASGGAERVGSPARPPPGPSPGHQRARFDWTDEELTDFYRFLSQYGTDFNAISVMYPGRTRDDIKRLYRHELRKRRMEVRGALDIREEIDLNTFRARLKRREELNQAPTRSLDQEEEETLRLIEAGALLSGTADEVLETHTSENADFLFDDPVSKVSQSGEASPVEKELKRSTSDNPHTPTSVHEHGISEGEDDLTLVEFAHRKARSSGSLPCAGADIPDRQLSNSPFDFCDAD